MAFELDTSDYDADDIGGKEQVLPGDYHMLVAALNEDGNDNGDMVVDFQVLHGTVQGQRDKIFQMRFKREYTKWAKRKLAAFALAARLITKEQLKKCQEEGKSPLIDWSKAVGRSVCMRLEESEDKKWINLAWDSIWSPDDKRAAHIPLHAAVIQREGIKLPDTRPMEGVLAKRAADPKPAAKPNTQVPSGGGVPDMSGVL